MKTGIIIQRILLGFGERVREVTGEERTGGTALLAIHRIAPQAVADPRPHPPCFQRRLSSQGCTFDTFGVNLPHNVPQRRRDPMTDKFYLGKLYDPTANKVASQMLQYDPDDLTTHGVVVGMTGSGKTGLCIALMEEAALQGIPAILIDPKGDLTNLLLHFPDLAPQDFQPWLDPELARRAGKTLEQTANDASQAWRKGLSEWGIDHQRLLALKNAAHFAVYTPGSDAGIPVSVLSSLQVPEIPWEGNRDILRERIASTVTALLGLVGFTELDPLRSREHILLANIFEQAWSQGRGLDL
ncbi:MAG: DUF853 family protein, partial [Chloroflexi bacterium]|nr:DUF853 family protein [Chloroflexota bacterium]